MYANLWVAVLAASASVALRIRAAPTPSTRRHTGSSAQHTGKPEQACRRIGQDDASRGFVRHPRVDPLDAVAIRRLALVRHERPVARPYQLLRTARSEQRVHIGLWICTAEAIRCGQLHPGVASSDAAKRFAKPGTLHACVRV